jgi:hypothetical protein
MEMKDNEFVLKQCGYTESSTKPNLFYRRTDDFVFFADMQGTYEIPIYKDTSPMMYWKVLSEVSDWKARRKVAEEFRLLWNYGCRCRFSGVATMEGQGLFSTLRFLDESEGTISWADGFCIECGEDFSSDGDFCSVQCELRDKDRHSEHCAACGGIVEYGEGVDHHASYFPEKTVIVHRSCHGKIHQGSAFAELCPPAGDSDKFYRTHFQIPRGVTKGMLSLFPDVPDVRKPIYDDSWKGLTPKQLERSARLRSGTKDERRQRKLRGIASRG